MLSWCSVITELDISLSRIISMCCCLVSGRSCVLSRGRLKSCQSSIPRSAWKMPIWLRHWRLRGRPSDSVREKTKSSTRTTRYVPCDLKHLVYKLYFNSLLRCVFLDPVGAEQSTGSRDHQDALHGSWGWAWRCKQHNTGKRALRVRSKRQK